MGQLWPCRRCFLVGNPSPPLGCTSAGIRAMGGAEVGGAGKLGVEDADPGSVGTGGVCACCGLGYRHDLYISLSCVSD